MPATHAKHVELKQAAPAALRAFFQIADSWKLNNRQARILLGDPPESTFYKWKGGDVGNISRDVLERVSYVLGIYKALQILLPNPDAADSWIWRANNAAPFGGQPAAEHMFSGNMSDLYRVRQYLDAQRGGW